MVISDDKDRKVKKSAPFGLVLFLFLILFFVLWLFASIGSEAELKSGVTYYEAKQLYDYAHGYNAHKDTTKEHVIAWAKKHAKKYKAQNYKYHAQCLYHDPYENHGLTWASFKKWYDKNYSYGRKKKNYQSIEAWVKKNKKNKKLVRYKSGKEKFFYNGFTND